MSGSKLLIRFWKKSTYMLVIYEYLFIFLLEKTYFHFKLKFADFMTTDLVAEEISILQVAAAKCQRKVKVTHTFRNNSSEIVYTCNKHVVITSPFNVALQKLFILTNC